MNVAIDRPSRLMSDVYNNLSGIGWNITLFLFAGVWLAGLAYTLYSLFTNFGEMSLFGLAASLTALAVLGCIAAVGTATSILGVYAKMKSLISGT